MLLIDTLVRIVSLLAALMLVTAGIRALRKFPMPEAILSFVRAFYAMLWPAPAAFLVLFALLILRARLILGFWPYPGHTDLGREGFTVTPSPLDPSTMPIHSGLAVAFLLVGGYAIAWAIPAYALLRVAGRRPHPATLSILVAGWVTLVLLPLCSPGGFFEWFMD